MIGDSITNPLRVAIVYIVCHGIIDETLSRVFF